MADPEVEITKQLTNVLEQWKNNGTKNCLLQNRICNNILIGVLILFFFVMNLCVGIASSEDNLSILSLFSTFCSTTYIVILLFKLKELQEEAISHGNELHFVMGMFESLISDFRINTTLYYHLKKVSLSNVIAVSLKNKLYKFLLELTGLNVGMFYLVNLQSKNANLYFNLMATFCTLILTFIIFQYEVLTHDFKNFKMGTVKGLANSIANFKKILKSSLVKNYSKISAESMEVGNHKSNAEFLKKQVENITSFKSVNLEKVMEKDSDSGQNRNEVLQEFENKIRLNKSLEIGNYKKSSDTNKPEEFGSFQDNFQAPVYETGPKYVSQLCREHDNSYFSNLNSKDKESENNIDTEQIQGPEILKEDSNVTSDEPQLEDTFGIFEEYKTIHTSDIGEEECEKDRGINAHQAESIENVKGNYIIPGNGEQETERGININQAESIENLREDYNVPANEEQETACGISTFQAESIGNVRGDHNVPDKEKQETESGINAYKAENIENVKGDYNLSANEKQETSCLINIYQADSKGNDKEDYNVPANEKLETECGIDTYQAESIANVKDYIITAKEEQENNCGININQAKSNENVRKDFNILANESQIQDTVEHYKEEEKNHCKILKGEERKTENATDITQTKSIENTEEDSNVPANESQLEETIRSCEEYEKNDSNNFKGKEQQIENATDMNQAIGIVCVKEDTNVPKNESHIEENTGHSNGCEKNHRKNFIYEDYKTKNTIDAEQTEGFENAEDDSKVPANESQLEAFSEPRDEYGSSLSSNIDDEEQENERGFNVKQTTSIENEKKDSNVPVIESQTQDTYELCKKDENNHIDDFNVVDQQIKQEIDRNQLEGIKKRKIDYNGPANALQLLANTGLCAKYEKNHSNNFNRKYSEIENGIDEEQTKSSENVKENCNEPTNKSQLENTDAFSEEHEKTRLRNSGVEKQVTESGVNVNQVENINKVKEDCNAPASESQFEVNVGLCEEQEKNHRIYLNSEDQETKNAMDTELTEETENVIKDVNVLSDDSQFKATVELSEEHVSACSGDFDVGGQKVKSGLNKNQAEEIGKEKEDFNVPTNESKLHDTVELGKDYIKNHSSNFNKEEKKCKNILDIKQAACIEHIKEDSNVPDDESQLEITLGLHNEKDCRNSFIEEDRELKKPIDTEQTDGTDYVNGDSKVPTNESLLETTVGHCEEYDKICSNDFDVELQEIKSGINKKQAENIKNVKQYSNVLGKELQLRAIAEICGAFEKTRKKEFSGEEQKTKIETNPYQVESIENVKEDFYRPANDSQLQATNELCEGFEKNRSKNFESQKQQTKIRADVHQAEHIENKQEYFDVPANELQQEAELWGDYEKTRRNAIGGKQKQTEVRTDINQVEDIKNANEYSNGFRNELQYEATIELDEKYKNTQRKDIDGEEKPMGIQADINQAEGSKNSKPDPDVLVNESKVEAVGLCKDSEKKASFFLQQ